MKSQFQKLKHWSINGAQANTKLCRVYKQKAARRCRTACETGNGNFGW
ncbi:hypothetical protein BACCAP_01309 [Pseudoflavonifractor capillosus ATCC 29799]|uniref:Uncharacterized protein n=1 Tax=Pseudoflavonifractor capillosus ATCC 29799 TaxID=411467 RepID=A6NSY1_9FIRM|nr:hypothetical protein BACCAP_01309 [Pseudoflavonifractor capillosus ATCC 29799]